MKKLYMNFFISYFFYGNIHQGYIPFLYLKRINNNGQIIKRENMDLSKKINRINMKKIYRKTNKK